MSGFTADWLALREAADHRARAPAIARQLTDALASRAHVAVVDVGCGTGSNLRATAPLLGSAQSWTLIDYDPKLLAAARTRLSAWADAADAGSDALVLVKGGRRISVRFREADLNRDLERALGPEPDLITASAFFDLASVSFIEHFARAVASRRAAFFTVLTYNGEQSWAPTHAADTAMKAAFLSHQLTDKGFGPAAGARAAATLAAAFARAGYRVAEGDSPWRLDAADATDRRLLRELVPGFAGAIRETDAVAAATIQAWLDQTRTGAIVGHTDTLALPPKG